MDFKGDPTPLGFSPMGQGQCICSNTTHTYYFYSGGQVIAEYEDTVLTAKYVYGNGQRLAKVNADGHKFYYHNDYLGSTRIMTDYSGSNIFERDYYPFGTELFASGSETDYKYNGKEFDDEIGCDLYYYGARFYDTNLGRFISVDPINQYTNPYSYVGNNPINRGDPTGMVWEHKIFFTKGGDIGGFWYDWGPGWHDDWVWGGVESFYGQDVLADLREYKAWLRGYYDLNVSYGEKDYTVRYRYSDENDWYIAYGEKDVNSLIRKMLKSGEYDPEKDPVTGEITTYCNWFVHDFNEL